MSDILTLSRAARRLGVTVRWLRGEAEAGRVPCVIAERRMLFDARVLLQTVSAMAGGQPAAPYKMAEWMDKPSCPGIWVCVGVDWADGSFPPAVIDLSQEDLDRGAPFRTTRVYGPIPKDDQ